MAKKRKPIKIKKANRGKLRKAHGTKKGKKISVKQLQEDKKSPSAKKRKQATFALNARKWNKGKKK